MAPYFTQWENMKRRLSAFRRKQEQEQKSGSVQMCLHVQCAYGFTREVRLLGMLDLVLPFTLSNSNTPMLFNVQANLSNIAQKEDFVQPKVLTKPQNVKYSLHAMPEEKHTIHIRISDLRRARQLTQEELAE